MTEDGGSQTSPVRPVTVEMVRRHRDEILSSALRHGVHDIRIFGSVARGEASDSSDVDLLVELERGRSLLDLGSFLMDVQDLLGRPVDVITTRGMRERIRRRALEEAVPL